MRIVSTLFSSRELGSEDDPRSLGIDLRSVQFPEKAADDVTEGESSS
jgi:hypothetical protein